MSNTHNFPTPYTLVKVRRGGHSASWTSGARKRHAAVWGVEVHGEVVAVLTNHGTTWVARDPDTWIELRLPPFATRDELADRVARWATR